MGGGACGRMGAVTCTSYHYFSAGYLDCCARSVSVDFNTCALSARLPLGQPRGYRGHSWLTFVNFDQILYRSQAPEPCSCPGAQGRGDSSTVFEARSPPQG